MENLTNMPINEEQKTIANEITHQNELFLNGIRSRMKEEYNALLRTNDQQAIAAGKFLSDVVNLLLDRTIKEFDSSDMISRVRVPVFLNKCMQSVNAIFAGGVISPLTGVDEEWLDTTVPDDIGQEFKIKYRGQDYSIGIESVQVNIRYPKIYRLNNDNRLAHRLDYIQFHDASKPENVHLTEDSIRFIQFPYSMQSIHTNCVVEDGAIMDCIDFYYEDIQDGLIYPDQSDSDPHSFVIAPKIPFYMLEDAGIDVDKEIAKYIKEINDAEEFEKEVDEEDVWDDED